MLSNNSTNPVPGEGVHHRGDPANPSGDSATRQWDVSRQIQVRIKNPDGISKEAMADGDMSPGFIANQPVAEDVPIAFPALDTEGNDDPLIPDEDVNPYAAKVGNALDHAFGELSSQDAPSARVLTNYHPPGNKFSVELNFREFARLEIWDGNRQTGKFWFRISDFKTWHHYLDAKYEEDKWVDGSSSHGLGHPNP